jgi:hypothetical protein
MDLPLDQLARECRKRLWCLPAMTQRRLKC